MNSPIQDLAAAQQELKRAYLMIEQGDFDQALSCCESAAKLADQSPLARILQANILASTGNLKEALGQLRQITKRWPAEPLGHLHFAEVCFFMNRMPQAQKALVAARALELDEEQVEFLDQLEQFWSASPAQDA